MRKEKTIMNFMGCEIILRATSEFVSLDKAEKEVKRIIYKEFRIPNKRELRQIVERDLGVKKHWLWGWIKLK